MLIDGSIGSHPHFRCNGGSKVVFGWSGFQQKGLCGRGLAVATRNVVAECSETGQLAKEDAERTKKEAVTMSIDDVKGQECNTSHAMMTYSIEEQCPTA